jgi:hypothetical protein
LYKIIVLLPSNLSTEMMHTGYTAAVLHLNGSSILLGINQEKPN